MSNVPVEPRSDDEFVHFHKGHRIHVRTGVDPSMSIWPVKVFVTHPDEDEPRPVAMEEESAPSREDAFRLGQKAGIAYIDQL